MSPLGTTGGEINEIDLQLSQGPRWLVHEITKIEKVENKKDLQAS